MKSTSEDISQYIQITNINNDIAPVLSEDPKDITKATYEYITNELDWQMLYTSGQWNEIVNIWLGTHLREIKIQIFCRRFSESNGQDKISETMYRFGRRNCQNTGYAGTGRIHRCSGSHHKVLRENIRLQRVSDLLYKRCIRFAGFGSYTA